MSRRQNEPVVNHAGTANIAKAVVSVCLNQTSVKVVSVRVRVGPADNVRGYVTFLCLLATLQTVISKRDHIAADIQLRVALR